MFTQRYKKPFKLVLTCVFIFVLIGSGILVAHLIRYSAASTRVCQQCHPELFSLWEKSSGHPAGQTKCFECHSQFHASIREDWNVFKQVRDRLIPLEYLADDLSTSQRCTDCHEDVLNFGYRLKKQSIQFNHRFHWEEGLICVNCHRTAGHEYLTEGTNRPTVEECLNCHLKEFEGPPRSQKCLNCHDVMLAPGKTW